MSKLLTEQKGFTDAVRPGLARIIINPEAGTESFNAKFRHARVAKERLKEHGWTVDRLISTDGRGHAAELAQIAR